MAARRLSQNNRYPLVGVVTPDAGVARRVGDAVEMLFGHRDAGVVERVEQVELGEGGAGDAARVSGLMPVAGLDLLVMDAARAEDASAVVRRMTGHRADLAVLVLLREPSSAGAADLIESGAIDVLLVDEGRWARELAGVIERSLVRADRRRSRDRTELELRRALSRLESRNRVLEETISRLETMAWTDPLTGMANRRQVEERLPQLFAEAARYGSDLSCLMIDLDGLKPVNDTYGHAAGDELLQLAGRIVTDSVRASDIAGRVGGDEFVVLMPRTGDAIAATVARRLADLFAQRGSRLIEREFDASAACARKIGMSIGVASMLGCQPLDGETLLACADSALYEAKRRGRNHVIVRRAHGRFEDASTGAASS